MKAKILQFYKNKPDKPRGPLGFSQIDYCDLASYYRLNKILTTGFESRMLRKFHHATLTEDIIVEELRDIGHIITDRQLEVEYRGIKGHIEGIFNHDSLFEIKTANSKSFKRFQKDQLKTFPRYYNQVQLYMSFANLSSCYYLVHNLETADICEFWVEIDYAYTEELLKRIDSIIESNPVQKQSYRCNYCDYHGLCTGLVEPDKWTDVVRLYHGSRQLMEVD